MLRKLSALFLLRYTARATGLVKTDAWEGGMMDQHAFVRLVFLFFWSSFSHVPLFVIFTSLEHVLYIWGTDSYNEQMMSLFFLTP